MIYLARKKNLLAAPFYIKETENVKNKENPILKKLINGNYLEDFLANCILQLLVNRANYFKNLTIADSSIIYKR